MSSFGSKTSLTGAGRASAAATSSRPKPDAVSRPGGADVPRRPAEDLRDLRRRQLGTRRPDPRRRAGDDRRREARAVLGLPVPADRARDEDPDARGRKVDVVRPARERRDDAGRVGRRDRRHVRERRRIPDRAPLFAAVAGRRDDERPERHRLFHGELDREVAAAADAEVDHAASRAGGGEDPGCDLAGVEARAGAERGVPGAQHGLGVDPHDADAVRGCADHRGDRRAVLAADPDRLLRVEGDQVRRVLRTRGARNRRPSRRS